MSFLFVDVESCDIKSLLAGVEDTGVLQSFLKGVSFSGFFFSSSSFSCSFSTLFVFDGVVDHDVVVGGGPSLALSFFLSFDEADTVGGPHEFVVVVVVVGPVLSVSSFLLLNGVVVLEL